MLIKLSTKSKYLTKINKYKRYLQTQPMKTVFYFFSSYNSQVLFLVKLNFLLLDILIGLALNFNNLNLNWGKKKAK